MNHTSLKIFEVVAEEMSIIKAAKRLGRVQSNITTRIQQLEQELDVQLFIRESKKLKLSPQGKQFLVYTKKLLSLAEEARQSLHPQQPGGIFSIGSMECTAASRLSAPLATFSRTCPEVKLNLTVMPTRQLTERVQQSELDCALVALPVIAGKSVQCPEDLHNLPLFVENLTLLLPASMSHVNKLEDITVGRLAAFKEGCTYRDLARKPLEKASAQGGGIQIQDVASYHSMMACVASGTYICLLPESVVDLLQLPEGLKRIDAGSAVTHLIWRKDFASPALEQLCRILHETSNLDGAQQQALG